MSTKIKHRTIVCTGDKWCKDLHVFVYKVWRRCSLYFTPEIYERGNTVTLILNDDFNETDYSNLFYGFKLECEKVCGYLNSCVSNGDFHIRFIYRKMIRDDHRICTMRLHTVKEYSNYLKQWLRVLLDRNIIDSVNYRTHKGLLRRQRFERVENYFANLFTSDAYFTDGNMYSTRFATLWDIIDSCTRFKDEEIAGYWRWDIPDDDVYMIFDCKSKLSHIRDQVFKECEKKRFTFKSDDTTATNLRRPNQKELKDWLKDELRYLHFNKPELVPVATYRTLCGQLKRYNFNRVFDFLRANQKNDIIRRFNDYKKTATIMEFTTTYTPVELVPVFHIDVEVNKDGK